MRRKSSVESGLLGEVSEYIWSSARGWRWS